MKTLGSLIVTLIMGLTLWAPASFASGVVVNDGDTSSNPINRCIYNEVDSVFLCDLDLNK